MTTTVLAYILIGVIAWKAGTKLHSIAYNQGLRAGQGDLRVINASVDEALRIQRFVTTQFVTRQHKHHKQLISAQADLLESFAHAIAVIEDQAERLGEDTDESANELLATGRQLIAASHRELAMMETAHKRAEVVISKLSRT